MAHADSEALRTFRAHLYGSFTRWGDAAFELCDEIVATPANTHDQDAVTELLESHVVGKDKPVILGDSAYANGATRKALSDQGFTLMAKCPPIRDATGGFTKERFSIDLEARTVTCPAGQVATITRRQDGSGVARFAPHCGSCPLRSSCTKSRAGRSVAINEHEAILQEARAEQTDPKWTAAYGPTDHSASARSPISCDADGVVDGDEPEDWDASPPISIRGPARSTGHALRYSD